MTELQGAGPVAQAIQGSDQSVFKAIFDNCLEAMLVTFPDGRIQHANAEACRLFGMSEREICQAGRSRLVEEQDPRYLRAFEERGRTGRCRAECVFIRKDGSRFLAEFSSTVFRKENGEQMCVTMFADITERKHAEEALAKEGRFRQILLDSLPSHIAVIDEAGRIIAVNEMWRRFARENGAGDEVRAGVGADYLQVCRDAGRSGDGLAASITSGLEAVIAGDRTQFSCEYPCHSPQQKRWFSMKVSRSPDLGGIIVVHRDVTDRKQTEEYLEQERARFHHLFENAPIALWLEDWTALVQWLDQLRREGIDDLRGFLRGKPHMVLQAIRLIKIVDVNQAAVKQNSARNKEDLLAGIVPLFNEKTFQSFIGELGAIWDGASHYDYESTSRRLDGERLDLIACIDVPQSRDGSGLDFSRVIVSGTDITERKRAEEARAELCAIVESSQDSIVSRDLHGIIQSWNAGAERLYGYTREEMIGKNVSILVPPGREREAESVLVRVKAGERVNHFETARRRRDGREVEVSVALSPIRDGSGDVVGISSIARDISEHKRHEELTQARLRLMQFAEIHPFGELLQAALDEAERLTGSQAGLFHVIQPDQENSRVQAVSTRTRDACRMEGGDRHYPLSRAGVWADCLRQRKPVIHNELLALPQWKGLPPGHAPLCRQLMAPVFRNDRIVAIMGVGNKAQDYTSEDADLLSRFADLAWDIAERKQSSDQIRKLSYAVEQDPAAIIITDLCGTVEYVNPKLTALTGYSREEVLGKSLKEVLWGRETLSSYEEAWNKVKQGLEWRDELQNRKKNGDWFRESVSVSPILDDEKQITHFLVIREDITEQKRLEEKLQQSQKMDAIGQLAGGVAHDFNNILASMIMQLELLRQGDTLGYETRRELDELLTGAQRAAALTRQLLMFSRRSMLDTKVLDVNSLVENVLRLLRRVIGEHIALSFEPESTLPSVKADPGMLEQVLMNLTVNARDALPDGGRILLSTRVVEISEEQARGSLNAHPGWFVCLSVRDNGCGMDEQTRKHLFEPFFTTKVMGKGTGLGLATVHGIVGQHKGWVEVESEPGRGSEFRVYLPAADNVSPKEESVKAPAIAELRGTETILLVEDEMAVRNTLARLLRTLGYRVLEAGNGREASDIWSRDKGSISLLLTDMVMPGGLTGRMLAETLRADKPGLKVIISSGYSVEIARRGQSPGDGIWFLPKPYDAVSLGMAVRECLSAKHDSRNVSK